MKTLYFHHEDFLAHDGGPGHPECQRLNAIKKSWPVRLSSSLTRVRPTLAEDIEDKLRLIHTPAMIDRVFSKIPQRGLAYLDADTGVSPGSRRAAVLAVSAACQAEGKHRRTR